MICGSEVAGATAAKVIDKIAGIGTEVGVGQDFVGALLKMRRPVRDAHRAPCPFVEAIQSDNGCFWYGRFLHRHLPETRVKVKFHKNPMFTYYPEYVFRVGLWVRVPYGLRVKLSVVNNHSLF